MTRKSGLGRGLDALISPQADEKVAGVLDVSIDSVYPNPRQPRRIYNEEELNQLSNSIVEQGIIQPLIVTSEVDQPGRFTLIAGERRLNAAKLAGLKTVPVIVREASDQQRLLLALIENVQRSDLNPMEEAEAYRQLQDDFGLTHEAIADRVAKSRPEVSNTLRLLKVAPEVQEKLIENTITKGHARALASLPTWESQSSALKTIINKELNVRQTEDLVERLSGKRPTDKVTRSLSPELLTLEEQLRSSLGVNVTCKQYEKGGAITFRYYSDEELNDLLDKFSLE